MKRTDLSNIMREAHRFIKIAGMSLSEALKRAWANFKLKLSMSKGISDIINDRLFHEDFVKISDLVYCYNQANIKTRKPALKKD